MKIFHSISQKSLVNFIIAFLAILCAGVQAQAASITMNFPLSASQQVPPGASSGTGSCLVVLNDSSGAVSVDCVFSGLTSAAVAAHIHGLAAPDMNAGVIIGLTATAATSGSITGNGVLDAGQITGMMDGLTYVNLHTSQNPGGELRGQVGDSASSIPSMSAWFMVVMVVLLLIVGGFALRRRTV